MLCPASAPIVLPGDSGFSSHQNANTALYESRTASCSQKWSFRVRVPFILCRYFLGDAIQHNQQIFGQVVPTSKQPKHHKSQPHSHDHNDKHIGKRPLGPSKGHEQLAPARPTSTSSRPTSHRIHPTKWTAWNLNPWAPWKFGTNHLLQNLGFHVLQGGKIGLPFNALQLCLKKN